MGIRLRSTVAVGLAVATAAVVFTVADDGDSPTIRAVTSTVTPSPAAATRSESPPVRTARPPEVKAAKAPTAPAVPWPVLPGLPAGEPQDPAALARLLSGAEDLARGPAVPPDQVRAAGETVQLAYRMLARRPEWVGPVLASVADRYRDDVRLHLQAMRGLSGLLPAKPFEHVPAYRIVEPLPAARLEALYRAAARRFGVPWEALAAINFVETRMGRIVGPSWAGANGPMQFIPETWATYGMGGNIRDPRDAILAAANYLRARGGADGTERGLRRALFAYNNDVRYVRAVRAYMRILQTDPRAYACLHAWRVFYRTSVGDILLPVGYAEKRPVPVGQYLARQADPR